MQRVRLKTSAAAACGALGVGELQIIQVRDVLPTLGGRVEADAQDVCAARDARPVRADGGVRAPPASVGDGDRAGLVDTVDRDMEFPTAVSRSDVRVDAIGAGGGDVDGVF